MRPFRSGIMKTSPVDASTHILIFGPIAANTAFVLELTLVPLLLPAIQLQLGLSIANLAWVFNAYGIAVTIGVLLGGLCGDAYDAHKVFKYGVALFVGGSFLTSAAASFETLLIGRALQGFGAGIFSPLVPIILTRAFPKKPGKILIVWGSIAGYVAAFAPLVFSSVSSTENWNFAFVLIALLALLSLATMSRIRLLESPDSSSQPMKAYSRLFRSYDLWVAFVYVLCTYGSITYYLFRLPFWLSNNEIKALSVGLVLSIMWFTFSGVSTLIRNMVDRPLLPVIMFAAAILIGAGLTIPSYAASLVSSMLSAVLVGAGLACSNAPSTQAILKFAPKGMGALSTSLDITFARLGGILIVSLLAESSNGFATSFIHIMCVVAAACAVKVGRRFVQDN